MYRVLLQEDGRAGCVGTIITLTGLLLRHLELIELIFG